jgi:hypothetical protein
LECLPVPGFYGQSWNAGIMEDWEGKKGKEENTILFKWDQFLITQYSNTPLFQSSNWGATPKFDVCFVSHKP